MAVLPPVLFHIFPKPLPYLPTLALQQSIHAYQLQQRRESSNHQDVLLLLQHRPTYTTGRRQISTPQMDLDEARLKSAGADWVNTQRGGETTFHGPGQIVGYPLFDLNRMNLSIREYICRLQTLMRRYALEHYGIPHSPSEHTGLFVSEHEKLGSIGVQVRHRLTTHGFAFNVTREPEEWFNQIVACGLPGVRATSIETSKRRGDSGQQILDPFEESRRLVPLCAEIFQRQFAPLEGSNATQLQRMIQDLQDITELAGDWRRTPFVAN